MAKSSRNRSDPFALLEMADGYWNLPRGVSVAAFGLAGGIGLIAFFLFQHLLVPGMSRQAAVLLVTVSWVLIFPIWAMAFAILMALLAVLGIRDIRAVVRSGLAELSLSRDQLEALRHSLARGSWRHGKILGLAVAETAERHQRQSRASR